MRIATTTICRTPKENEQAKWRFPSRFAKAPKCEQDRNMEAESVSRAFAELSTPLIADAGLRLKIPIRIAPPGIRAANGNQRVAGPALPVRHFGSVDVFLEAMQ